jgi:hypothetical protein
MDCYFPKSIIEDNMKTNIIKLLLSPFWFSLILGLATLILFLSDIWVNISQYLFQLIIGFLVGSGLGLTVFCVERFMYIHHFQRQTTSQYQITSLPKMIYLLLLTGIVLYSKSDIGYMIAIASGVYLLTLAFVLFKMRKNQEIMIK